MLYKTLIVVSLLEFFLAVFIGGNYMLGIEEYAVLFGSDELTIFRHAEYYLEVGSLSNVPLKYVVSSLLIAFSLKFGSLSILVLFSVKYLLHIGSVYILLRSIHPYVNKSSFVLFATFLYLNPVFHSYHTTILRDDLILSFAFLIIGYSTRIFDRHIYLSMFQKGLAWTIVATSIVIGTGLRPEIFLLLTMFLGFMFFISLGQIKRIGIIFVTLIVMWFYGEKILLMYSYALAIAGWFDFIYVLEAFRVFYLSPAPWNIITIVTDIESDASKTFLWFYMSFFVTAVSVILFPLYAFKNNNMLFKISSNNPIGMWFFYFPLFVTVSYGLIASDMVFLGPRQGALPSALLTLVFINTIVFALSFFRNRGLLEIKSYFKLGKV